MVPDMYGAKVAFFDAEIVDTMANLLRNVADWLEENNIAEVDIVFNEFGITVYYK